MDRGRHRGPSGPRQAPRCRAAAAVCCAACPDLTIEADPRAYHAWLVPPDAWRAESFTAAAAERGIAVAPATAFAVGAGHAPNAVRLALASPSLRVLGESLRSLRTLALSTPQSLSLE